ncbi:MAG: cupin domain-containing protein, partial [Gallionella sp.]
MRNRLALLGGLTVSDFLRDYWQKKPLLIRRALPQVADLLDPRQLLALACEDDAQARLVIQQHGKFELRHSPFAAEDFDNSGKKKVDGASAGG